MGRPRPKKGERRIDAAIDHLAQYGFAKPQIRKIINDLLQLYGKDGWLFLEEGSYRVVLDRLLEEQAQKDQKQEAVAVEEASAPQNDMEVSRVHGEAPDESRSALEQAQKDQKQEAAAVEEASAPQNGMEVSRVHGEAPDESRSALELQASPNSSPPLECVLPLPPAKGPPRARPPCYGWISEESETESEPEDREILSVPKKDIPNPVKTLPSKRKRPSRWDVRPSRWDVQPNW